VIALAKFAGYIATVITTIGELKTPNTESYKVSPLHPFQKSSQNARRDGWMKSLNLITGPSHIEQFLPQFSR